MSDLTWGGVLSGKGFVKGFITESKYDKIPCKSYSIKSERPIDKFELQTTIHISQTKDLGIWQKELLSKEKKEKQNKKQAWNNVEQEWLKRWNNSYISINEDKDQNDLGWQIGRNYQLFRAMLAANSKGKYPTMFNGGLFVCESDPDVRNWYWSEFMAQNQRLVYWPMLKSGDNDLLDVALNFYKERTEVNKAWAKHFWGLEQGHFYVEDINIFGLPCYNNTPQGHSEPDCLTYHYTSGMEFALMMLERARFNNSDIFPYMESVLGLLKGFDGFYRKKNKEFTGSELNKRGQYEFYPGSGLELDRKSVV